MKVAIQGERGSFHQLAAQKYFGDDIEIVYCKTFADLFARLARREVEAAVAGVENSIAGTVPGVQELLQTYSFPVLATVDLPIHHCLIALLGAKLADIQRVYSQDIALPQCSDFLDRELPRAERLAYYDTVASVQFVKSQNDPHAAAIAGRLAADLEHMAVLRENIENRSDNITRFAVLGPHPLPD